MAQLAAFFGLFKPIIMLAIKKKPFRELPVRKRMTKPEWFPPKGGDGEEPEYKLSFFNGIYHMCRFEVGAELMIIIESSRRGRVCTIRRHAYIVLCR